MLQPSLLGCDQGLASVGVTPLRLVLSWLRHDAVYPDPKVGGMPRYYTPVLHVPGASPLSHYSSIGASPLHLAVGRRLDARRFIGMVGEEPGQPVVYDSLVCRRFAGVHLLIQTGR